MNAIHQPPIFSAANTSVILYPYSKKITEQELIDMLLLPLKDTSEPDEASEEPDISKIAEPDSKQAKQSRK